jgi:DeoR family transcriptional regulator, aga operon transcriptional repressor
MTREERWEALLELLAEEGRVTVEQAAHRLGVSPATVRRDLDALAGQRMLRRTRGGAVAQGVSYELPMRYKETRHADRKRRIGEAVAALLAPGDAVGLTGGTTTTEVARALARSPALAVGGTGQPALTVVTNALNIAAELAIRPQFKIVVTGGVARPHSYELTGPLAAGVLEQLTVDTAVLGVNAFDSRLGAWTHQEDEAAVNRLLCHQAGRVVVAADASKLTGRSFARICAVSQVDTLVTDDAAPSEILGRFTAAGVTVITV